MRLSILATNPRAIPSRSRDDAVRRELDALYASYNRRGLVHPDPLELLYRYDDPEDQEIAGLVSSCLAYGRVRQILSSASRVLDPMGKSPRRFLQRASERDLSHVSAGFVHRFTTERELAAFLVSIKRAVARYGSLERLFMAGFDRRDATTLPALAAFVTEIRTLAEDGCPSLLPSPADGSACKRLNLFLRWMARRDEVDPGTWRLPPSMLVIPLDTHMHRIARALGLTSRAQANLKTALEVTEGFSAIRPRDPVRYDFCLTRTGIRSDLGEELRARLLETPA
jgi:uncharacterized protein (TIGR02757 family)